MDRKFAVKPTLKTLQLGNIRKPLKTPVTRDSVTKPIDPVTKRKGD